MDRPTVLAYYFPSWHHDQRNAEWFGAGWTEWELLRRARPRFPGHRQPRVPAGGEFDEATLEAAEQQIELARAHGVDGFLVDFYWYDDDGYLEGALERGLLAAPNVNDISYALMWANHNLVDIFPSDDPRAAPRLLKSGSIDRAAFERMGRHLLSVHFPRENYLKVDGSPWLSVYELASLVQGLGGIEAAADALEWLRREAVKAGFPGIHLDAVVWGFGVLPEAVEITDPGEVIERLGFASATSYVWVHHADLTGYDFPCGDAARLSDDAFAEYERYARALPVPFHPNVTVGWDSSPRTRQDVAFTQGGYPWGPVFDLTPDEFESGLRRARDFSQRHPRPFPVVTINAWNEWTEGSALLPDADRGDAYLRAIARVFGRAEAVTPGPG